MSTHEITFDMHVELGRQLFKFRAQVDALRPMLQELYGSSSPSSQAARDVMNGIDKLRNALDQICQREHPVERTMDTYFPHALTIETE